VTALRRRPGETAAAHLARVRRVVRRRSPGLGYAEDPTIHADPTTNVMSAKDRKRVEKATKKIEKVATDLLPSELGGPPWASDLFEALRLLKQVLTTLDDGAQSDPSPPSH
jgi:hypothetical protein